MSRVVSAFAQAKRALRQVLVEAQGNCCALCGERFGARRYWIDRIARVRGEGQQMATLEHIVALRDGGSWLECVAAHKACNNRKGHRPATPEELVILKVTWNKVSADPRLKTRADAALAVLDAAPAWAEFTSSGQPKPCSCNECRALDDRYPDEGTQLLLPMLRHY